MTTTTSPFDDAGAAMTRWFPDIDPSVARLLLAAWVGNSDTLGDRTPIWPILIAPASFAKTELLSALAEADDAELIDSVTPQTFLSGYRDEQRDGGTKSVSPSLLTRLGDRPKIILKDLSGILEQQAHNQKEIYAAFRAIYDGYYSRQVGSGLDPGDMKWAGFARVAAGATPSIDSYQTLANQLGERFVGLRWDMSDEARLRAGEQALDNQSDGAALRRELSAAFRRTLASARAKIVELDLSPYRTRLAHLAAFVAKARTSVPRDSYRPDEVLAEPAVEGIPRLVQQLYRLMHGLVALRGTPELHAEDYQMLERLAFDCIAAVPGKLLWAAYCDGAETIPDLQHFVRVSKNTIRRRMEDLHLVGLVAEAGGTGTTATRWAPTDTGRSLLARARGE